MAGSTRRRSIHVCAMLLGGGAFCFGRGGNWLLLSLSAYASLFLTATHRLFLHTETVVHVGKQRRQVQGSTEVGSLSGTDPKLATPADRKTKPIEWCDFGREGHLCTLADPNCTALSPKCKWPPEGAPVAVIFSDRLVKSGMVTMTSLCRHPTTLYVMVLMQVSAAAGTWPALAWSARGAIRPCLASGAASRSP